MLKVPKLNFSLLCLVSFLVIKDIAVGLGQPVFIFLFFIFLIPSLMLIRDMIKRTLGIKNICMLGFLTLFYLAIVPMNGTGLKYFLPMVFAGYAFRNTNYKQICLVFLGAQFFVILSRMLLVKLGYVSEELVFLSYKGEYGTLYHDLGYGNPNTAGMVFFFFVVSLHLFMYERQKMISFLLILIISLFTLQYTGSRTSFFASVLLMLIYITPNRIIGGVLSNRFLLLCIPLVIILPLILSNWLMDSHEEVNELLSNRVYIVSLLMEFFSSPITLLTGTVVEEGIPIDNVFCYMLINYGIISIIIFFFRYLWIINRRNDIPPVFLASFVIMIISGFGEAAWAAFGGMGASFFWVLLFNNTYDSSNVCAKRV